MTVARSLAWTGFAVGISVVGLLTMRRGHISTQVVDERAVGWGLGDDIAQAAGMWQQE